MRKLLCFSLLAMCFQVSAYENRFDLELDVFGLSYHSNREYEFNEVNYGLGINIALSSPTNDYLYLLASTGVYKDSYSESASFAMFGFRGLIGSREEFHATASLQVGYLDGSGSRGTAFLPVVSFGYDWLDVCVTGSLSEKDNNSDPADDSRMGAVFLKLRVLEF